MPTATRRPWMRPQGVALLALLLLGACAHRLTAEQMAVLRNQGFVAKDDRWELGLSDKMLFATGSDQLQPQTKTAIEHTGGALNAVGIRNVRVEGHTDNVGTDALNLDLSRRRAAVVAQAMNQLGTNPIAVRGFGKDSPIADNATEAGRAENRRVSVIVPDNQE